MKTVVTGGAATVGATPGAAAGALTSPVTGPVEPVVGGLATGTAASAGAEKLYEDSRFQELGKAFGREAIGKFGYDCISKEGRLLRQVNGLKEELQHSTDPTERAKLQGRLTEANAAFGKEAERNGRYFEGRADIDKAWEQAHAQYPKVDKDDIKDALAKHIDAGKRPEDAARGALSDVVNENYPRKLPYEPVENYSAMSCQQLGEKHRQYVGELMQDREKVQGLTASHKNFTGKAEAYAQHQQTVREEGIRNEFWRDDGLLSAIRQAYKARGMEPPELPRELRPQPTQQTKPVQDTSRTSPHASLSPQQEKHLQQAHAQLSPALGSAAMIRNRYNGSAQLPCAKLRKRPVEATSTPFT